MPTGHRLHRPHRHRCAPRLITGLGAAFFCGGLLFAGMFAASGVSAFTIDTTWEVSVANDRFDNGIAPPDRPFEVGDRVGVSLTVPDTVFPLLSTADHRVYHLLGSEVNFDFGGASGRLHGSTTFSTFIRLRRTPAGDTINILIDYPRFEYDGRDWKHGSRSHRFSFDLQAPLGMMLPSLELDALRAPIDLSQITFSRMRAELFFSQVSSIDRGWFLQSNDIVSNGSVVPEPGTVLLMGGGLMVLSRRGTRRGETCIES